MEQQSEVRLSQRKAQSLSRVFFAFFAALRGD
jgi:hypothetical protein